MQVESTTAAGYQTDFLAIVVPLPRFETRMTKELTYPHFTIRHDPVRRLPAATAVNINGPELIDLARAGAWHFDNRIPASEQAGNDVYANNSLDRGHQVRRRDPVWGANAAAANEATFVFTNAAPQASEFNQSKELWVGLEDHILTYATATEQKISVFTGPVLGADDPPYRGVQIPLQFWKIAVWATREAADGHTTLRSAGFVLNQSPYLPPREARPFVSAEEPPSLGPFRTFQVPVRDIADLAGLDIVRLSAADVISASTISDKTVVGSHWRPISDVADIAL